MENNKEHNHNHSHKNTKAVINRLSRAIGHLESVKRMVEEGRDCSEVLIQVSAVKSSINNIGKIIKNSLRSCRQRDAFAITLSHCVGAMKFQATPLLKN